MLYKDDSFIKRGWLELRGHCSDPSASFETQFYAGVFKTTRAELGALIDLFILSVSITSRLLAFASHASITRWTTSRVRPFSRAMSIAILI